jgi:NTP pyrophosphatase (non-canonical NTP hydrolase)
MRRSEALSFVEEELDWQNKKWGREDGDWPSAGVRKLAILAEEFGEVAIALNDGDIANIKEELADVAATCIAWLMSDY